MTKRKALIFAGVSIALVSIIEVSICRHQGLENAKRYKMHRQQCLKLTLGMTPVQVRDIMGIPRKVTFGYNNPGSIPTEIWQYENDPTLSTPIYCTFDNEKNVLIDFLCGE